LSLKAHGTFADIAAFVTSNPKDPD